MEQMTPSQYVAYKESHAGPPIDGLQVVWYEVKYDGLGVTAHRATYHLRTPWSEHQWGAGYHMRGADFVDTWSHEIGYDADDRWQPQGRWERWGGLAELFTSSSGGLGTRYYDSSDEGRAACLATLTEKVRRRREEIEELEGSVARLRAEWELA